MLANLHINQDYFVRYQKKLYRLTHDQRLYAEKRSAIPSVSLERYEMGETIKVVAGAFKIESQTIGFSSQLLGES